MKRPSGESPAPELLRGRLREAEERYGLLAGVPSVLVACSGGADSVALLHLLSSTRQELGLRLGVAHLHHGLRGADADADAEYVAALAARLELPLVSERADVPALARETGQSLEAAARSARYEFLERAAEAGEWERVALAHTASDRVETVLLNLLRGSGLHGLRGMPAARGRFIRPLLTAWRVETEAYCAALDLRPRVDRSNLDPEHATRNRVRLELLPLLRDQYNPAADEALLRLAEAVEEELEWTEPQVEALAERGIALAPCPPPLAGEGGGEGSVEIDLAALVGAPAGLRYRLLRAAWARVSGESWDLSAADYRALDHLAGHGQTGSELALPRDIVAQMGYTDMSLIPGAGGRTSPPPLESHLLADEGATALPEVGLTVRVERTARPLGELGDARRCQILIDGACVVWPLRVRGWELGDRLVPLGMSGHRKVQDVFTDNKVPRAQRGRVPLVVDAQGEIVWVVGHALSERVKVTDETREFVRITVEAREVSA
jgi:tRNA(Ile)-lysidine synthase